MEITSETTRNICLCFFFFLKISSTGAIIIFIEREVFISFLHTKNRKLFHFPVEIFFLCCTIIINKKYYRVSNENVELNYNHKSLDVFCENYKSINKVRSKRIIDF